MNIKVYQIKFAKGCHFLGVLANLSLQVCQAKFAMAKLDSFGGRIGIWSVQERNKFAKPNKYIYSKFAKNLLYIYRGFGKVNFY